MVHIKWLLNGVIRALLAAWSDSKIQEELEGAKRQNQFMKK